MVIHPVQEIPELFTATTLVGVGALCSWDDGGCLRVDINVYGSAFRKLEKLSYVQLSMKT